MITHAHPFKLRQLQYFLAVAELRHFTKAAELLNVTQPTLSHQIGDLEGQLGTPLFDRLGKAVRLTEAGALFLGFAEAALKQIESGRTAIAELHGLSRGLLRIGASQSFVRRLLPPLLGTFTKEYPGIAIEVYEMTAQRIEDGLYKGDLDVAIGYAPALSPETELEPLFEEHLLLVVGHGHSLAHRAEITLAELEGIPLVIFPREYTTRIVLEDLFKKAGIAPKIIAQSNSVPVMLGMVQASNVGTIVLESALSHEEDFKVIRLADPSPTRTSALMWSRHVFRSSAAKRFAEMVRQSFSLMVAPPKQTRSPKGSR
ncbi:MAG: transcriptional regulator CynR [Rhodospirillaceae bacterium]|nr:MAG: transcriptional regulator CynR [Rhodospirillaceae bacterium]